MQRCMTNQLAPVVIQSMAPLNGNRKVGAHRTDRPVGVPCRKIGQELRHVSPLLSDETLSSGMLPSS